MSNLPHPDLEQCPLAATLTVVGDRWSLLILRSAFDGLRHFEEFQASLGIARNILTQRLARMVDAGILSRDLATDDRRKVNYELTLKGAGLLPVLLALRQWGERWAVVSAGSKSAEETTIRPVGRIDIIAADGREFSSNDLGWAALDCALPPAHCNAAAAS